MSTILETIKADITTLRVNAIVNAANQGLAGGGGVDGAIHRAGGPSIAQECAEIRKRQGGCPTGQAVCTNGGNLPSRFVIHTVGPVWDGGRSGEAALLASCYQNSLEIARILGVKSIAFPSISTGIYSYPLIEAVSIAVNEVKQWVGQHPDALERIIFCAYDDKAMQLYQQQLG